MSLHVTTWAMQISKLPCCSAIIREQFCVKSATYIVYLDNRKILRKQLVYKG